MLVASVLTLPFYANDAHAGFYKCIDVDENTTYSQAPCPHDEKTDKVISAGGGSSSNNNCSIARHFMFRTAKQMKRGQSSGEVFGQYGGLDSIPRTSVALINYIYTFQHNYTTTPQRITALSVARCSSGSFGPTSCEDFPTPYIDSLGGCENAALGPNYQEPVDGEEDDSENSRYSPPSAVQPSASALNFGNQTGIQSGAAVQRLKSDCITRTKAQLGSVRSSMQGRQTSSQQDSLRAAKRRLQKKLDAC